MSLFAISLSVLSLLAADDGQAEAAFHPILDIRLRYELASQDDLPETAHALTLRGRAGFETARRSGWALLVEGEFVADLAGRHFDGVTSQPGYPVIADPETIELNRLQLSWQGEDDQLAVIGRQSISIDDQRLVGPVGFRQNSQSFDAVRFRTGSQGPLVFDYAYIVRVNRIFGRDHPAGHFDSDSHMVRLSGDTPAGAVSIFGLWLDFENAPVQSSQTLGVQLTGESSGFGYRIDYARQSAFGARPGDFSVDYVRAETSYAAGDWQIEAGVEFLGGNGRQAFQTPLATLHKFQGWADVFLTTPSDGLRDFHVGASHPVDWIEGLTAAITFHDFASDDGRLDYGNELDASLVWPLGRGVSLETAVAVFDGGRNGSANRQRVWVALNFGL